MWKKEGARLFPPWEQMLGLGPHNLQQQFEERKVKKKYLALVKGSPHDGHGVIDIPLSADPINHPRQMVDYEHGKRACGRIPAGRTSCACTAHTTTDWDAPSWATSYTATRLTASTCRHRR